ncbi:hypothetical protein [Methanobrevibacter sp.]|uniref:hypothetical protein n=1 Tax=Methanobrevibacter sp. TaxID=66852 RepID=UPI0038633DDC
MSSRSATVLVIFIVAIIAFCFACVCASITGPISILPNESDTGGILDNLSAITDDTGDSGESYGNPYSDDYSSSSQDYSSSSDSDVETTVDDSSSDDESDSSSSTSSTSSSSKVETTTEETSYSSVETTVDKPDFQ